MLHRRTRACDEPRRRGRFCRLQCRASNRKRQVARDSIENCFRRPCKHSSGQSSKHSCRQSSKHSSKHSLYDVSGKIPRPIPYLRNVIPNNIPVNIPRKNVTSILVGLLRCGSRLAVLVCMSLLCVSRLQHLF